MAVSTGARRAFALFLLAFGVAMAIAALADSDWVSQKDQAGQYGTYHIGLTTWAVVDRDESTYGGDCTGVDLDTDSAHDNFCLWSDSLLGNRNDWRSAGEGALGIGCIAVIVQGFALIFNIVNLATNFSKKPAAFLAFFSGVAYFIGALVYEGMRPSWGGDMGYNYPIGLYMAAGLMAEIATIALWSADGERELAAAGKGSNSNNFSTIGAR